jgi:hypothetical protein
MGEENRYVVKSSQREAGVVWFKVEMDPKEVQPIKNFEITLPNGASKKVADVVNTGERYPFQSSELGEVIREIDDILRYHSRKARRQK